MGNNPEKNNLVPLKKTLNLLNASTDVRALRQGIRAGLKGMLQGINERSLPFSYIELLYPALSEEIRQEYDKHFPQMDLQLFFTECYEYGIKKVYYHEWKEYEKEICY